MTLFIFLLGMEEENQSKEMAAYSRTLIQDQSFKYNSEILAQQEQINATRLAIDELQAVLKHKTDENAFLMKQIAKYKLLAEKSTTKINSSAQRSMTKQGNKYQNELKASSDLSDTLIVALHESNIELILFQKKINELITLNKLLSSSLLNEPDQEPQNIIKKLETEYDLRDQQITELKEHMSPTSSPKGLSKRSKTYGSVDNIQALKASKKPLRRRKTAQKLSEDVGQEDSNEKETLSKRPISARRKNPIRKTKARTE